MRKKIMGLGLVAAAAAILVLGASLASAGKPDKPPKPAKPYPKDSPYSLTAIGKWPYGLNDRGDVVGGLSRGATILALDSVPTNVDLGHLALGEYVEAWGLDINNLRQVVGWGDLEEWSSQGNVAAWVLTPQDGVWYRDDDENGLNDLMIRLYPPDDPTKYPQEGGDVRGAARAINDLGQVVGFAGLRESDSGSYYWRGAFLWQVDADGNWVPVELTGLDGQRAWDARDINDSGQVAGSAKDGDGLLHAVLWEVDASGNVVYGPVDLGYLSDAHDRETRGINNLGQVVGYAGTSDGETHAFLWEQGAGMIDLGSAGRNGAESINDAGQAVGSAVLWEPDEEGGMTMTPLNELIPIKNENWVTATHINDSGQILAGLRFRDRAGYRPRLLTPTSQ